MSKSSRIHCFRASYSISTPQFEGDKIPDWLSIETNWQGYKISTLPWVADVARALGILAIEDSTIDWIEYLESIGFKDLVPVCCDDLFEDRLFF